MSIQQGEKVENRNVKGYVGRPREAGRSQRRHSTFRVGLSACYLYFQEESCEKLVMRYMELNREKLPYYRRGLRALRLVTA